ncbi:MAG: Omp28-related outer membrane protein [Spirochaetales bacterium]|nr:Omp28-related outer membrane protein [Spirochaetales bacterium]
MEFRKFFGLLLFVCFLLIGCPNGRIEPDITGEVVYGISDTFVQKLVIEEVTGAWCGYCVDGAYRLETVEAAYPGQVTGVAIHTGDGMAIPEKADLTDFLGGYTGVPCGSVNRTLPPNDAENFLFLSRGYWSYMANLIHSSESHCGIRIDSSLDGDSLSVTVSYAYTLSPVENNRLTVYLTEDEVTGYPQSNYYSFEYSDTNPDYIYYNEPATIEDWEHNHVLREILSDPEGDILPSVQFGVVWQEEYAFSLLSEYDKTKMNIVAIIHTHGDSMGDREVLNVQWCPLGGSEGFSEL